jgi:hypothetical protein
MMRIDDQVIDNFSITLIGANDKGKTTQSRATPSFW